KLSCVGAAAGAQGYAWALTTWTGETFLYVAFLPSGPPLARLDYVCVREPSAEWSQLCASVVPPGVMECRASCTIADSMRGAADPNTSARPQIIVDIRSQLIANTPPYTYSFQLQFGSDG